MTSVHRSTFGLIRARAVGRPHAMDERRRIEPLEVFNRGLADPMALSAEERLVYLLMELETCMDLEGWDAFFMSRLSQHYGELKAGLGKCGDRASLAVLEDYERHLRERGVPMEAAAITRFLAARDDEYLLGCRDWREAYAALTAARWRCVSFFLRDRGITLLV